MKFNATHHAARLAGTLALQALFFTATAQTFVWLEGEKPTSANVEGNPHGWGNKHFMSGEAWLHYSIDDNKIKDTVPEEGILLKYDFDIAAAGEYEVWARVGFEGIRATFDWRINENEWQRKTANDLTTDLMEIGFWCELAWLDLGKLELAAGRHVFELRLPAIIDANGKAQRIVFAIDAVCISLEPFHPYSHYKPGEDWRKERDHEAAAHVFTLPETPRGERSVLPLNGLWEVTRNDEQVPPFNVAQPMMDFPEQFRWTAIPVPSDRNESRPDLVFSHRLWYRTRVEVPENMAGRSFFIRFPQNNLNTTVFVNGEYCGFFAYPFADFNIDVTAGVKPGVNEIWVGIRDAWYGYSTNPDNPRKLRNRFNTPARVFFQSFQELAWPLWKHPQSGILATPEFTATGGPIYTSDIFAKPSVAKKELAVELTLKNPTKEGSTVTYQLEVVNTKTGEVEKKFAPGRYNLEAGEEKMVELAEAWEDPKLWWPDEPNLYWLRATVAPMMRGDSSGLRDVHEIRFGFREWDWSGREFKLNGVKWSGWSDCFGGQRTKEEWLKFYKEKNQQTMRVLGIDWYGLKPREAFDFFDENGVVVRRSGELWSSAIGYWAIENDPVLKALENGSPIKMDLFRNWRGQIAAQVRGERNHPSIMVWSMENEFIYINCINLYGDLMDLFEAEVTLTSEAVMAVDPTRPTMVDGGGALKANTLPVHGDHYITGPPNLYPPLAYKSNTKGGGRGRWEWDEKRPRFMGEDYYMTGNHPEVAYFQGDGAFAGKPVQGIGLWNRILQEGYRWNGQGAWCFYLSQNDHGEIPYAAFAARAVFSRDWNWTFAPGVNVKRTFGVFNDTRFNDPITFTWTLMVNGKKSAGKTQTLKIPAGEKEVIEETIPMPKVSKRTEAELVLELFVNKQSVFRDVKAVSILPPENRKLPGVAKKDLAVFDPEGAATAFLTARKIPFTPVASLDDVAPASSRSQYKILLIGGNALDAREAASSRLAALAASGLRVIVLDQNHTLRHQGLPAEMAVSPATSRDEANIVHAANFGFTAFGEDYGHPVLAGLADKDFFTFANDAPVYRNVYEKPVRGARSLVQCHDRLRHTALAEIAVGTGLLVVNQLNLSAELGDNPAAQQLVLNLLGYAASYKLEYVPVHAYLEGAPELKKALDTMGLKYKNSNTLPIPREQDAPATFIVHATPEVLAQLAQNLPAIKKFTAKGGSLILCGVTPEGLADYNKIVGVDHVMRPFTRERVVLPPLRSRLTTGLSAADVTMFSSERIFNWTAGNYVASDVFSFVVDYDDPAPFGTSTFFAYKNIVNGFVSADGWPLIQNFPVNRDASPYQVPIAFPKEYEFTEFTWIGNTMYAPQTKINLVFNNDRGNLLSFDTAPNNEPHVFEIAPPRKASEVTLEIAEWQPPGSVNSTIGIDNIYFKVKRPAGFYNTVKPFVNIGGLMEYEMGKGRVVLCNLLFQENETVPENAGKKRRVLSTTLRNLKAPFASEKTLIAGMNLKYAPVDISAKSTQYRDEQGWFGDRDRSFKDFPHGLQRMAGVPFDIYEMPTSPVPNALMLKGGGIPGDLPETITGIPVNQTADALFLLHAARIDRRIHDNEKRAGKWLELAKYAVHYADGESAEFSVFAERDVDHYAQANPAPVPGAQIAWQKKFGANNETAVAYLMQWNNPRPGVAIVSLDLLPGKDNAGVPALLALTAAQGE